MSSYLSKIVRGTEFTSPRVSAHLATLLRRVGVELLSLYGLVHLAELVRESIPRPFGQVILEGRLAGYGHPVVAELDVHPVLLTHGLLVDGQLHVVARCLPGLQVPDDRGAGSGDHLVDEPDDLDPVQVELEGQLDREDLLTLLVGDPDRLLIRPGRVVVDVPLHLL